jgi:hypothetical protein
MTKIFSGRKGSSSGSFTIGGPVGSVSHQGNVTIGPPVERALKPKISGKISSKSRKYR